MKNTALLIDFDGTLIFRKDQHLIARNTEDLPMIRQLDSQKIAPAIEVERTNETVLYIAESTRNLLIKLADYIDIFPCTGGRSTTGLNREHLFPQKGMILESGGIIKYEGDNYDFEWVETYMEQLHLLHSFNSNLIQQGFNLDNNNRYTASRIRFQDNPDSFATREVFEKFAAGFTAPKGLTVTRNLGHIDIHPEKTGKGNALDFIRKKFGYECIIAIGDDFNDESMLLNADIAMVPGHAAEELKNVPHQYLYRTNKLYVEAINEFLHKLLRASYLGRIAKFIPPETTSNPALSY